MGLKGLLVRSDIVYNVSFAANSGEIALDYGVIALLMASLIGLLEIISILVVRHEVSTARKFYEGRDYGKDFVEHLDAYLTENEDPDDPNSMSRLEALGIIMGRSLFEANKYSAMQSKSVMSRKQNQFDDLVKEKIERKMPPGMRLIQKALDYLDIDLDLMDLASAGELPLLEKSLRKYGIGSEMMNPGLTQSDHVPTM